MNLYKMIFARPQESGFSDPTTKRRVALFPLVLFLCSLIGGCGGDSPEAPFDEGKIIFVSRDTGFKGINIINSAGNGRKLLLAETSRNGERDAAFSPDGSKIVFLSNRENCGGVGCRRDSIDPDTPFQVWVMNTDGSGLRQLTQSNTYVTQPSFSADGSRIIYEAYEGNEPVIRSINVDGSGQSTFLAGKRRHNPSWSPDGTRILFSSPEFGNGDIHTINTDGTGEVQLTSGPSEDIQPSFSPDGSKIVFCRTSRTDVNRSRKVYVMNADGTGQTRLTDDADLYSYPSFSPDGLKIVFQSNRGLGESAPRRVFVMNIDGSDLHPVPERAGVSPGSLIYDSIGARAWAPTATP